MKQYTVTTTENLRTLCIKYGWFKCGSNKQYEKLFRANELDFSIEEIATIIWLCSDDEYCGILLKLREARIGFWKRVFGIEDVNQTYQVYDVFGVIHEAPFTHIVALLGDPEIDDFEYESITGIYNLDGNTVWEYECE